MTTDQARVAFGAASASAGENRFTANQNYGPPLCVLGLLDLLWGTKRDALREGPPAQSNFFPVKKDAINGPRMDSAVDD